METREGMTVMITHVCGVRGTTPRPGRAAQDICQRGGLSSDYRVSCALPSARRSSQWNPCPRCRVPASPTSRFRHACPEGVHPR